MTYLSRYTRIIRRPRQSGFGPRPRRPDTALEGRPQSPEQQYMQLQTFIRNIWRHREWLRCHSLPTNYALGTIVVLSRKDNINKIYTILIVLRYGRVSLLRSTTSTRRVPTVADRPPHVTGVADCGCWNLPSSLVACEDAVRPVEEPRDDVPHDDRTHHRHHERGRSGKRRGHDRVDSKYDCKRHRDREQPPHRAPEAAHSPASELVNCSVDASFEPLVRPSACRKFSGE